MRWLAPVLALLLAAPALADDWGVLDSGGGAAAPVGGATAWGWIRSNASGDYAITGDCGSSCLNVMPDDANWTCEWGFISEISDASVTRQMLETKDNSLGFAAIAFMNYNDEANSFNLFGEDGQEYEYPNDWEANMEDTSAWHFYSLVHDMNGGTPQITLYIDGVSKLSGTDDGFAHSRTSIDVLRFCGGDSSQHMRGKCTELRCWNDVRTTAEVAAHDRCQLDCTDGGACPDNLVLYYPTNEGSGALNEYVNGGSTYDMTLQGAATWDDDTSEPFGGWTNSGSGDCISD